MMRIVGGKYRHRLIAFPEDKLHIRPTKDRIREAIFSALGNIDDRLTVDLYAGSGAMGLEAISRNVKKNIFVDINPLAITIIKENLASLQIPKEQYDIYYCDAFEALGKIKEAIDLLFIDPPYQEERFDELLSLLIKEKKLNENAIIVFETNRKKEFVSTYFKKIKEYKYGDIYVYIFWR